MLFGFILLQSLLLIKIVGFFGFFFTFLITEKPLGIFFGFLGYVSFQNRFFAIGMLHSFVQFFLPSFLLVFISPKLQYLSIVFPACLWLMQEAQRTSTYLDVVLMNLVNTLPILRERVSLEPQFESWVLLGAGMGKQREKG